MREALFGNQVGSRLNLLQARDARLEVEFSLAHLQGSRIELVHELAKLQSERQAFVKEFRRADLEQLVEDRGKRDSAADELQKADLRRHMTAITAPADGVVLEVAHRSIGSVVREAENPFRAGSAKREARGRSERRRKGCRRSCRWREGADQVRCVSFPEARNRHWSGSPDQRGRIQRRGQG